MRHLSGALWKRLEAGERAVLVTVLKTAGSVPRTTGAAMALFADGTMAGTVGGGAVEFAALETAHGLLAGGESCVRTFSNMPGADEGCCCGGRVTLLFQPLGPEDAPFFKRAAALAGGR